MNVTIAQHGTVTVITVNETRLTYPVLADFATAAADLISRGGQQIVIDLSSVGYVDSATIGCLMDLYRQATAADGRLRLAGVQKRVETMLTMTGAHHFLEVYADQTAALASFGG
jgi:anti-sigma B factor antagonist